MGVKRQKTFKKTSQRTLAWNSLERVKHAKSDSSRLIGQEQQVPSQLCNITTTRTGKFQPHATPKMWLSELCFLRKIDPWSLIPLAKFGPSSICTSWCPLPNQGLSISKTRIHSGIAWAARPWEASKAANLRRLPATLDPKDYCWQKNKQLRWKSCPDFL